MKNFIYETKICDSTQHSSTFPIPITIELHFKQQFKKHCTSISLNFIQSTCLKEHSNFFFLLERSWNGLGTVLERSWNGIGTVFGTVLERSLERSWNGLGTFLERSWNGVWNGLGTVFGTVLERYWNGLGTVCLV